MTLENIPHLAIGTVAGALLLLLPGYALRQILILISGDPRSTLGAPDRGLGALLDSLGLSLAGWPLILLYGSLAGITFSTVTIWQILAVAAFFAGLGAARHVRSGAVSGHARRRGLQAWAGLALVPLLALTGLALVLRFIAVDHLLVGLWGDSLTQTLVTQLFIEQGQVPDSYRPYAPADSFTYHFGFHTLSAIWSWLTGETSWQAVITVGQVLNALAVPAAYVLTRELFRSRLAGLSSAVVVGFLSGMPTAYVNWGRYTQLAGQILLPFVICWFLRAVENRTSSTNMQRSTLRGQAAGFLLAAIGAAGLGLTHYRVLIMFALFVIGYCAVRLLARFALGVARRWSRGGKARRLSRETQLWRQRWPDVAWRCLLVAVLGGLLFLPWWLRLQADYLNGLIARLDASTPAFLTTYNAVSQLTSYVGVAMPTLAFSGLLLTNLVAPMRARLMALVVLAWTALLTLATQPSLIGLPGDGALNTISVAIAYYLPLAALAGPGIAGILQGLLRQLQPRNASPRRLFAYGPIAALLLLAVMLVLNNPNALTIDNRYAYMTPDDSSVMQWIVQNTPPDATFLISSQVTFVGRAVTATDAGMWIPVLTGRYVTVPPLSVGSEGGRESDLEARTRALHLASMEPAKPDSISLFRDEGIDYIYIGQQTPTIPLKELLEHGEYFELLHKKGRVYVFALR